MDVINICQPPLAHNELEVQKLKEALKTNAEELIYKGFPETIIKVNKLLQTPKLRDREFSNVHQNLNIPIPDQIVFHHTGSPTPSKKLKLDNSVTQEDAKIMALPCGSVPTNKNLIELVDIVKPHIRKLIEDSNLLKLWISFMIPKIEDGNNFGVSIQNDTLEKVQFVETEAVGFYHKISEYFISRGKLISKVGKYPHLDDYHRAVREMDENEYLRLCLVMARIRNSYFILHDIVIKNLDKIKKPRSTHVNESFY